ncbi:hypothetical protein LTR53_004721 [Teratosphaeriaceae sp. CCFEE 6253]|nr:hypothetical protein LTR53_004721 [Teratosphaeriaceae sp. CCFEE 6253]
MDGTSSLGRQLRPRTQALSYTLSRATLIPRTRTPPIEIAEGTSAMTRVLKTPELLEAILLHSLRDESHDLHTLSLAGPALADHLQALLVNQRVNVAFATTIRGSPRLHQALFFRYSPAAIGSAPTKLDPDESKTPDEPEAPDERGIQDG